MRKNRQSTMTVINVNLYLSETLSKQATVNKATENFNNTINPLRLLDNFQTSSQNKYRIHIFFLFHIGHSPRRTMFWDLKQVSVHFKELEKCNYIYIIYNYRKI